MDDLQYQHGFGNHFQSEAITGALPQGQNSPQRAPLNLYPEQLSGTAFTAPRASNRRSWLYRRQPSVAQCRAFKRYTHPLFDELGATTGVVHANPLRWSPLPIPEQAIDFFDSWMPWAVQEGAATGGGMIILYACRSGEQEAGLPRYGKNNDGELLLVPQQGGLSLFTEFGQMEIQPGDIAVIPRGVFFKVDLLDEVARGYLLENQGTLFQLPELGPIGANGLANSRDFKVPEAAFEADDAITGPVEVLQKTHQQWWHGEATHSPLDVVAWHGNYVPYCYSLKNFNAMNTVTYDHPDPSIFTVLTSPSTQAGTANIDFVLFPDRWMVAEHTFRPPYFHRNLMSEYMGLIKGEYDAKDEGFVPGGGSLHCRMLPHGPDVVTFEKASTRALEPERYLGTMAFMFESRADWLPCQAALESELLQQQYTECWQGFTRVEV